MKLTIVAVGRLKESYWREAADEYLKRLGPYATVRVVEVTDRDPARGEVRAMAEEGADAIRAIPENAHVIALDIEGKQMSSEEFSKRLEELALAGKSNIAFVVGGAGGLAPGAVAFAGERLSLGPMTLPHNLARVVLLEQLYRAFRISRGEPYHK